MLGGGWSLFAAVSALAERLLRSIASAVGNSHGKLRADSPAVRAWMGQGMDERMQSVVAALALALRFSPAW